MHGFKSLLTLGKFLFSLIKLPDFCLASVKAEPFLLPLQGRQELWAFAGGQTLATAALGGGCRQLPPQTITHIAEYILHAGKKEGVSCNAVTASAMRKAAGKGDPELQLCQV